MTTQSKNNSYAAAEQVAAGKGVWYVLSDSHRFAKIAKDADIETGGGYIAE